MYVDWRACTEFENVLFCWKSVYDRMLLPQWELQNETLGFLPIVNSSDAIFDLQLLLEPDTNNAYNCLWNDKYKTQNQNNKQQQSQTPFFFQQPFFLKELKAIWNFIKSPEAETCTIPVLSKIGTSCLIKMTSLQMQLFLGN